MYRRRRWRRNLRRGRYHPIWKRTFRRRYRRWRRPRHRTVRPQTVKEYLPGRHRYIWVTGWEPLGNICQGEFSKTEATPYKSVEPQAVSGGQWHGTWGKHYFTPGNLMLRALTYWNQWSEDWASFDYVRFLGARIYIPQTATCPWMINLDEYLNVKLKDYNPKNPEDEWVHPGILINNKRTHMIFPPNIYPRKRMYKISVPPPPGWKGYQRLPEADAYILFHWVWTFFDPTRAFFDPSYNSQTIHTCQQEPWWGGNAQLSKWVDRNKYDTASSQNVQKTWGPFLPGKYVLWPECSVFFLYKIKLKVVGNSIWRPLPRNIISEGLAPDAPGPQVLADPDTSPDKRKRPQSDADIWPEDLDAYGLLKEKAFERIAGDHHGYKRRRLDRERRLRSIARKLRLILQQRRLIRFRDNPPRTPP